MFRKAEVFGLHGIIVRMWKNLEQVGSDKLLELIDKFLKFTNDCSEMKKQHHNVICQ